MKQVVKDVRFLIDRKCCDETIQARITNFINERDEALLIQRVSQQRELLKAFQEYYQTGDYNDEYPFDENINRFLKGFNCG